MRNLILVPMLTLSLAYVAGQAKPEAPVLTPVERLQLQVISQKLEIAQLKAQAAQRDFDTAREDFSKLLASLQKEGFTLDLQKLEYTPVKKEK